MSNDMQQYTNGASDKQLAEMSSKYVNPEITIADMAIPRMMVVQAQSKMEGAKQNIGALYNSVTGEFKMSVKAIMVKRAKKTRAVFPPIPQGGTYNPDLPLLCRSFSFSNPENEYVGNMVEDFEIPTDCSMCILKEWGANGAKPVCTTMYTHLFMDIESGLPFTMTFMKTAIRTSQNLNTLFETFGKNAVVMLQTSDKGTYCVPEVKLLRNEEVPVHIAESAMRFDNHEDYTEAV